MKKILLIKESSLLRDGIIGVLKERLPENEIATISKLFPGDLVKWKYQADLIIIDLDAKVDLLAAINHFKSFNKKVIVWSSTVENENLTTLFKMNLDGYFYNGMESEELVRAIRGIFDGRSYIHSAIAEVLLDDYVRINTGEVKRPIGVLSRREWEVLDLMSKGFNNQQIGEALYITDKTVKNHVSAILKKLQVSDRTNAILKAVKKRWIYL